MTDRVDIAETARVAESVTIQGHGRLTIEPYAVIEPFTTLDLGSGSGEIRIGARAKLKQGVVVRSYNGFVHVGARVSVGEYSVLSGHGGLTIGATTIIAGHCYFAPSEHIMLSDAPLRFQGETATGITLAPNVWVGAHVTVQDGVIIGGGAVIGSGSVVTKSLPAGMVCYGSPCRPRRAREVRVKTGDHKQIEASPQAGDDL